MNFPASVTIGLLGTGCRNGKSEIGKSGVWTRGLEAERLRRGDESLPLQSVGDEIERGETFVGENRGAADRDYYHTARSEQ